MANVKLNTGRIYVFTILCSHIFEYIISYLVTPPASRYRSSPRPFPEDLPPIEYTPDDIICKVHAKGEVCYLGREWKVGKAFHGYPVALRHSAQDGVMDVFFCQYSIASINLHEPQYTN